MMHGQKKHQIMNGRFHTRWRTRIMFPTLFF